MLLACGCISHDVTTPCYPNIRRENNGSLQWQRRLRGGLSSCSWHSRLLNALRVTRSLQTNQCFEIRVRQVIWHWCVHCALVQLSLSIVITCGFHVYVHSTRVHIHSTRRKTMDLLLSNKRFKDVNRLIFIAQFLACRTTCDILIGRDNWMSVHLSSDRRACWLFGL